MAGCPVRFVFAILVAGVALGMAPRAAHAQSYGLGEQALHIGAADFRSTDPVDMPGAFQTDTDGYLWNHTTSVLGFNVYAAPLHLPTGAQVTSLCLYYFDQRPTGAGVSLDLHASKFVPGGQLARVVTLASVVSTGTSGYGVDCADVDPPLTISDLTVLPGDATLDIVTYYVKAHVWGPDTSALGGVRDLLAPPGQPGSLGRDVQRRSDERSHAAVHRGAFLCWHHGGLRRQQLLSGCRADAPSDGRVPGQGARPALADLGREPSIRPGLVREPAGLRILEGVGRRAGLAARFRSRG